jgi:hypothetical protein
LLESDVGEGIFFAGLKHVAIKVIASYTEDQIITSDPSQILAIKKAKQDLDTTNALPESAPPATATLEARAISGNLDAPAAPVPMPAPAAPPAPEAAPVAPATPAPVAPATTPAAAGAEAAQAVRAAAISEAPGV